MRALYFIVTSQTCFLPKSSMGMWVGFWVQSWWQFFSMVCLSYDVLTLERPFFCSLNRVWFFATLWTVARQASLSFTILQSLFKLMSIESVMPSSHFILYHPLFLLLSVFPSIRAFSSESALCHQVAKVLELQLQYQSFQWILRTDLLRTDWLTLLAVQYKGL